MDCSCPYCSKPLMITDGPGDYTCAHCEGSFAVYRIESKCPSCRKGILADDGPGWYTCPECDKELKVNKDGTSSKGVLDGFAKVLGSNRKPNRNGCKNCGVSLINCRKMVACCFGRRCYPCMLKAYGRTKQKVRRGHCPNCRRRLRHIL